MLLKDNIKRLFHCNLTRLMTLLKLRRVNKRLQGRLSTLKTAVSKLMYVNRFYGCFVIILYIVSVLLYSLL